MLVDMTESNSIINICSWKYGMDSKRCDSDMFRFYKMQNDLRVFFSKLECDFKSIHTLTR